MQVAALRGTYNRRVFVTSQRFNVHFKAILLSVWLVVFGLSSRTLWSEQAGVPVDPGQNQGVEIEQTHPFPGLEPHPEDEQRLRMEKDMAKRANLDRQAQIKRDTASLLKLATELQQYVDKSNESILSLDVIKKADEIEKLAHSVKEKMKGP